MYNVANKGALVAHNSSVHITISKCDFAYNIAAKGGAIYTSGNSSFTISNSNFTSNIAVNEGGVIYISGNSSFTISNSNFISNIAVSDGGVIYTSGNSSFTISKSSFTSNSAIGFDINNFFNTSSTLDSINITLSSGGVISTSGISLFIISKSSFTSNIASAEGGVIDTSGISSFIISNSNFTSNIADSEGGVIYTSGNSSFTISKSGFTSNSAVEGGVMTTSGNSSFTISNSNFTSNIAVSEGGVIYTSGNSSFTISKSSFTSNSATGFDINNFFNTSSTLDIINITLPSGGVISTSGISLFIISKSSFTSNIAVVEGGVIDTSGISSFIISNSNFTSNIAASEGGVIYTLGNSLFTISKSSFTSNIAVVSGGVMTTSGNSSFTISICNFTLNSAFVGGVMVASDNTSFTISNSVFNSSNGTFHSVFLGYTPYIVDSFEVNYLQLTIAGVIYTSGKSIFTITGSNFTYNSASIGGVMCIHDDSAFSISNSRFTSNIADFGGVMSISGGSSFTITNSIFASNSATVEGGVISDVKVDSGITLTISNSNFTYNSARYGGVIGTSGNSLTIINSIFLSNKATSNGGMIDCVKGTINIDNSNFSSNTISTSGIGNIFISQCSTIISNSTFNDNIGSIYILNGNLTFSGNSKLENSVELLTAEKESTSQEGGVITSFQSTVIFATESNTYFLNNQARRGGAILAIESTIIMYGEATIANSNNNIAIANSSGGGISLKQSRLEIRRKCHLVNNSAVRGGGIHASSSTIAAYQPGILQITNNTAEFGGGMYLEINSKLYVLKVEKLDNTIYTLTYEGGILSVISENKTKIDSLTYYLNFTRNIARYGGAVYVADVTNSGTCLPDSECFIQILALHPSEESLHINIVNILFSENAATVQGSNLFGGLLDRCIPSPFAEVYRKQKIYYSGATYLQNICKITQNNSISSQPVRVCFCDCYSENYPDCSYQLPTITVKKGEAFNVSVVAVDQVNNTVDAKITTFISSPESGLGEGQQTQSVRRNCTDLTYNVYSPHDSETINLFPDGPCGSAALSTSHVTIQFKACTCPVGFQPLSNSKSSTRCECICDSTLDPYINDCDDATSSVSRIGTNSWITYVNDTDAPGYIIYPNCPFDYCQPSTKNVSINFNQPNGPDTQCAYNRTRLLCGSCKENFSLSLASSCCLPCHSYWPAVCVVTLLAAILAGILLVTTLLCLNMTVSIGLINGYIFYANIVSAGSAVFFPSSEPSFPSVFVAWLNLDIGIDVCFIDGLDTYIKTWIQLAFPMYVISLVVIVIKVSEYSPRFVQLIGRNDPVSTLATLVLLSYAKLLSVTITALSFATLNYPDGKQEIVWRPDGNVRYFQGKHIPLVLVAVLIILIGLPYTSLLFLWQWIVRASRWKIFKWTRNTKLNAFVATYHVPHNSEYRYWTGLLLLVRVAFYVTASVTVSSNPQTLPLISIILIGGLFLFKSLFALRVYKNSLIDVVDTMLYINLLVLSGFSLYDFKVNRIKQTAVAYTSTIITFMIFIGSISYHVRLLIKKYNPPQNLNEYPLLPVQAIKVEVTHSVIEPPN